MLMYMEGRREIRKMLSMCICVMLCGQVKWNSLTVTDLLMCYYVWALHEVDSLVAGVPEHVDRDVGIWPREKESGVRWIIYRPCLAHPAVYGADYVKYGSVLNKHIQFSQHGLVQGGSVEVHTAHKGFRIPAAVLACSIKMLDNGGVSVTVS